MRTARYVLLGILALTVVASSAMADDSANARNFGTVPCSQKFSCSTPNGQLADIANSCTSTGFGISSHNIFDGATPDSSNCMSGTLPSNGSRPMTPQCCVINDGDACSMRCSLMMY